MLNQQHMLQESNPIKRRKGLGVPKSLSFFNPLTSLFWSAGCSSTRRCRLCFFLVFVFSTFCIFLFAICLQGFIGVFFSRRSLVGISSQPFFEAGMLGFVVVQSIFFPMRIFFFLGFLCNLSGFCR